MAARGTMKSTKTGTQGFTLIASLMLLLMLSGVAIGLLMMVNTEARTGSSDLQNSRAYHAAEGGIEKMSSDLINLYQNVLSPQAADIQNLSKLAPTNDPFVQYTFQLNPHLKADGTPDNPYGKISSGPYKDLYASIMKVDLTATADMKGIGQEEVSMMRTAEVALIPVFQFGVFSDSDLGFFSSPDLDFAGRVHTNGDLYLGVADCCTLTFHDNITAFGEVIRKQLPNGLDAKSNNDNGDVNILTASQGCDGTKPACKTMDQSWGSVVNGPGSAYNGGPPSWQQTISPTYYNLKISNGNWGGKYGTGVKALKLPFVGGGAQPYEIIRLPKSGESKTDPLGASRLVNQAQIRILMADNQADLHLSDWDGDATQDVQLVGDPTKTSGGVAVNGTNYFFAWANDNTYGTTLDPDGTTKASNDPDFIAPYNTTNKTWPLIGGWLRVEVNETDGDWHGVTKEWLALGFARGLAIPNTETSTTNALTDHKNAILYLQELADRNGDGVITNGKISGSSTPVIYESTSKSSPYNYFPINLYDAREGEARDKTVDDGTCAVNGIMNAVELDVGNLKTWLANSTTGKKVDYNTQNGYILYFSDRRGMLGDPNDSNKLRGEYGFEDVINASDTDGVPPNGTLEPAAPTKNFSPEDVNLNGRLDNFGGANVGDGFGVHANVMASSTKPNPYVRVDCYSVGRKNRVTAARHILKLVDGTMGNLPTRPDKTGGFTVASENPVYIQGNYNSNSSDPTWSSSKATEPAHAAAAILADAVTLLSNNWDDDGVVGSSSKTGSLLYPSDAVKYRPATTTYYRVAIAAGKNINFPIPSYATGTTYGFGTDGGLHNFLRFLENWSNDDLYYKGSLVSLFYSNYATGTFKCCAYSVYEPPDRHYIFDPLFAFYTNLPPGTPMFRDIENLSYRQNFTARTY